MSITTDNQVTWIHSVNAVVQEMNHKIFKQLLKHINSNPSSVTSHAHRLTTGLFSLVEREIDGGRTKHIIAYTSSGQIQLLSAQLFYNQRADWYALLDNNTTNLPPHELLKARITQIRANAKQQLSAGGRNLLLNSNQTLPVAPHAAANREDIQIEFSVADFDLSSSNSFVLSVYVKHANDLTRAGSRWWRIALELSVLHTDGSYSYPKAIVTAPVDTAYNGRISNVWTVNKPISQINHGMIFVQNIDSNSEIVVSQPKLEIGTIATVWTPAVEDVGVEEDL